MKLKQKDLRVSNWILYNGTPNIVLGIHSPSPDKSKRFDSVPTIEINPPDSFHVPISEISGIKITPKRLVSMGFQFKDYQIEEYSINIEGIEFSFRYKDLRRLWIIYDGGMIPVDNIKFIHQIQNLIFSLTGKEIEVKLPVV